MKVIGLTGGIGSGKSTVAKILMAMGYPVYFSDDRAKEIVQSDLQLQKGLSELLGPELFKNGQLDRAFMANKIFSDERLRNSVNELIHPKVRADFESWLNKQQSSLVFNEAAILFETGSYKRMDKNILVVAPEKIRLERVLKRDKVNKEEVLARMQKQWSDEQKIPLADFILYNDEVKPLLVQVEKLVEELNAQ